MLRAWLSLVGVGRGDELVAGQNQENPIDHQRLPMSARIDLPKAAAPASGVLTFRAVAGSVKVSRVVVE